jgi:hypothetical protein
MPDDSDPKEFDTAARDRVRRKIIQYMADHRIGVIKLAGRITQASPRKPEIPIKTLQRFLAGRHRTNDMYVRFFQHFAEGLPDPDPIGELGRSMAAIYGAVGPLEPFGPEPLRQYQVIAERDEAHSNITVTPDGKFRRLHEVVSGAGYQLYDGAMVFTGSAELAVLRDRLLGLPKTYMLRLITGGFSGQALDTDINGNQSIHQVRLMSQANEQ